MSFNPVTDFLGLLRLSSAGAAVERMPGLDYVVASLARAGLIQLSTGQTAPVVNQSSTAWLKPAQPSWTAEGVVFLWNVLTSQYELATPTLWTALLTTAAVSSYSFQSAPGALNIVLPTKSLVAIQRAGPGATTLVLPTVASQLGKPLQILDWSTAVVNHVITLAPSGGATIMRANSWELLSTPDQLAGVTLYPSTDLNGWGIAP